MHKLSSTAQLTIAALTALLILHVVMLLALFSGVDPKPPAFFGPFIGATIAVSAFTIPLVMWQHKYRLLGTGAVLLMAFVGVGPHKIVTEPDILVLSPIVTMGTVCLGILVAYLVNERASVRKTNPAWAQSDGVATSGD